MAEDLPRRSRTTIHSICEDLLDLILLHIPSVVGIVRAAATCKLWRRVIGAGAGDAFLRRFRRLHGPQIIGHYYYAYDGCIPSFVPLPAPPPGQPAAIGGIGDLVSFDFFPNSYPLKQSRLTDSRGGLLAFVRNDWTVLVWCPWTRQHREAWLKIPWGSYTHCLAAFLLDGGDETGAFTMSNFRFLYVHLIRHRLYHGSKTVEAWVFSARDDDQWLQLGAMAVGDMIPDADIDDSPPFVFVGRAGGSLCWSTKGSNAVLHLDESTGEFSNFTLPGEAAGIDRNMWYYNRRNLRVVGGDASAVYLVRIAGDDLEVLRYARRSGRACVVERRIRVPQNYASIDDENQRQWYSIAGDF
ncbi:unnamed protein product [Urochloa decumbens]|uniref:F-box domain-containing protein n=1 Tax=Urochloa decumbens TaxID=240449 RepID=A0ABC8VID3_9POAL